MLNALIVDDHSVVRMGMKMFLEEVKPDVVVYEANSFQEALSVAEANPLDLVVLDIVIPGGEDTQMISLIRRIHPAVRILVFSTLEEERYALRYIQAGADGFLSKLSKPDQCREAIRAVLKNERYVSALVHQQALTHISERRPVSQLSSWKGLSKREIEITKLLVEGMWTKEIAQSLNLKESTISTFKRRIFEKAGVSNSMELAKKYQENEQ